MKKKYIKLILAGLLSGGYCGYAAPANHASNDPVVKSDLVQSLEAIFYDSEFAKIPNKLFQAADFGAKGDSKTINTKAIQATIDAVNKVGGGILQP